MASGSNRIRRWLVGLTMGLAVLTGAAQTEAPTPGNSRLDALLFFQLLVGELQLQAGQSGSAYEVVLDAARRTSDPALFQRAVEISFQARAGDQALAAARAWRSALPTSVDAIRHESQILLALNRPVEALPVVMAWISASAVADRSGLIAALPRLLQRLSDRTQAATLSEQALAPYRDRPDSRTAARVALGRLWLAASDAPRAVALAAQAQADDPGAPGPALLALDMLTQSPQAEPLVRQYLARPDAEMAVRLAYVRNLAQTQRLTEALAQLNQITQAQPELAQPWLTLGAVYLDLRQSAEADAALQRFLALAKPAPDSASEDDTDNDADPNANITQARLMLAQAAEQRNDFAAADRWLSQVDNPRRALDVQSRRASLWARQGRVDEARRLIRQVPETTADEARAKLLSEAQLLRDIKRWKDAADVLVAANERFADDADLLYEQAMVEERLERAAETERLLRRVIELKPDHAHAHNALGYSLADRNTRLPEARALIQRALELTPGDPFITDSLGWVEFRLGNHAEALRLLQQAYNARPDAEIAAHLGEVLWVTGRVDEARKVWAEARQRDSANDVLKDTLARLKVGM